MRQKLKKATGSIYWLLMHEAVSCSGQHWDKADTKLRQRWDNAEPKLIQNWDSTDTKLKQRLDSAETKLSAVRDSMELTKYFLWDWFYSFLLIFKLYNYMDLADSLNACKCFYGSNNYVPDSAELQENCDCLSDFIISLHNPSTARWDWLRPKNSKILCHCIFNTYSTY